MKKLLFFTQFLTAFFAAAQKMETRFETSGGKQTATYFECIDYYTKLDAAYPSIKMLRFDTTDAGYPLHLVLYSKDRQFNVANWHKQGKLVVLINNGIHPGEPDGIDASMMFLRDLASGKLQAPDNVVIGVIPVYNIGGSLNRNSFSRVNQNGPESYGFRGNAQNLDLNRDFIKADSRNAKSFYGIFHYLNPDVFIDNHVSDGADYQHTMTLLTTQYDKLGYETGRFLREVFEPAVYKEMESRNWVLVPYVTFDGGNTDRGWVTFYDPPRYSSGYASLFQTLAFVPETHMLKPYPQRVKSTYDLMVTMVNQGSRHAGAIKEARKRSLQQVQQASSLPLSWTPDTSRYELKRFMGYTPEMKTSEVTGKPRLFYNHDKPFEKMVKYFSYFKPATVVQKPRAYVIPQGWHAVTDLLRRNGVVCQRLPKDTIMEVEYYRIEEYKTAPRAYEKHHRNSEVKLSTHRRPVQFLKGDYLVFTGQPADRYIVETLEPLGDDSFFSWNFFDAILQQKEGYSDYRWEDVAAQYLKEHPELRTQLEEKKKADPAFAASASQQLNFVYRQSPWYEPAHLRYPVFRITR